MQVHTQLISLSFHSVRGSASLVVSKQMNLVSTSSLVNVEAVFA